MPHIINYAQSGEFAADLELIHQAAVGALSHHDDAESRADVTAAIQSVLEFLFSAAERGDYRVPGEFWAGDLGRMVAAARLWASGDALITHSEAALLLRGAATPAALMHIERLVQQGRLTRYADADEPNPRRAGRVSREEVEALR